MNQLIDENLKELLSLNSKLKGIDTNIPYNHKKLIDVFSEYQRILLIASNYNEDFKRNLQGHFSEINSIEIELKNSTYASSQKKKDDAFSTALENIKSDLSALIELIKNSSL